MRWSTSSLPSVSIIIPTRDRADLLSPCLESLYRTRYDALEIIIVDNDSKTADALDLLHEASRQKNTRVLSYGGLFNYAAINNFAVKQARGEILCFLNNDT